MPKRFGVEAAESVGSQSEKGGSIMGRPESLAIALEAIAQEESSLGLPVGFVESALTGILEALGAEATEEQHEKVKRLAERIRKNRDGGKNVE